MKVDFIKAFWFKHFGKTKDMDVERILEMILETEEDDIDCEKTFERLHEYAEKIVKGEKAARLMPLIEKHLSSCSDCQEEYEALLRALRSET